MNTERIQRLNELESRLVELRRILKNDKLEDTTRAHVSKEYRDTEAQLHKEFPHVRIMWMEADKLLIYMEDGKPIKAMSGKVAKRKWRRIREIIKQSNYE